MRSELLDSTDKWSGFGKVVTDTVNRHGHAFQQAVLRTLDESSKLAGSGWKLQCSELPVQIGSAQTKIDAVLTHDALRIVLTLECKRVSIDRVRWVFFSVPQMSKRYGGGLLHIVRLVSKPDSTLRSDTITCVRDDFAPKVAHLGIQVLNNQNPEAGKESSRGSQPIEDACGQVLTASGGLQSAWTDQRGVGYQSWKDWLFVPILVSNAELFRSAKSLSDASLNDGKVTVTEESLIPADSIIYQYPVSMSLTSKRSMSFTPEGLAGYREIQMTRSVLVFRSTSLEDLIVSFPWSELRKSVDSPKTTK